MHPLKWQYQPRRWTSSWPNTLLEQRFEATDRMEASPLFYRNPVATRVPDSRERHPGRLPRDANQH